MNSLRIWTNIYPGCCKLPIPVWETKFMEYSPENRCPLYVLYKISLAQANFQLAQLKMHLHWQVLVLLTGYNQIDMKFRVCIY